MNDHRCKNFSELYEIPPRNGVYKSKEFQGHGTKYVKMNELFGYNRIDTKKMVFDRILLTEKEKLILLLKNDDLLFSRTSVVADGVGKCSIVEVNNDELAFDSNIIRIRLNKSICYPKFYFYYFNSPQGRALVKSLSSGTAVTTISGTKLSTLNVPFPDIKDQDKIATILSAYDDLIENNTRRIRILEEMALVLYREWFVEFRFPGYEDVKMVPGLNGRMMPEGWDVVRLSDKIELAYGKALKASERHDGSVPVFGSSGIVGWHDEPLAKGPGIIVGRKGNVGSVYWSYDDFYPIDTVYYVKSDLPLHYVYYNLQHQNFINADAAVPGLSRRQAYSLPLILPDKEIINEFEVYSEDFFTTIKSLQIRNQNLMETRDLLLPRLIEGEIDVSNLDIAIPEAIA